MSPPHNSTCLLTTTDTRTGKNFPIDTGAQVTVIPVSCRDHSTQHPPEGPSHLLSANGSTIRVHCTLHTELHLAGKRFPAHVLYAEVDFPFLGADFL